ncbi:MAG TPA: polysaccharide deacetylase family protein [Kofleriaceae bacterium]|nr:polysaccharide deacetylase family protein [Kofleriaceae bacterium]
MKKASTAVLAVALSLQAVPGGARTPWPRPAAGESESGDPEVIFTFDDGPHETWSAQILDTLAAHHVSAIFYWVGHRIDNHRHDTKKREVRRDIVRRAISEGHLVGNHTVNHLHLCHSRTDAAAEIDENDRLYQDAAELPIVMFRTPYGDHCPRVVELLAERGLTHMHWDIDPREWMGLSAEGAAASVIARLRRLQGRAVILMHDTKAQSARALPRILDWIEAENARRLQSGKRPIRILSGSDLLIERERGPLWLWGEDTAQSARQWLTSAVTSLVPGAPTAQVPGVATAPAHGPGREPATTHTSTLASPY